MIGATSRERMGDHKYFSKFGNYLENDPDAPACFLKYLMERPTDLNRLRFNKPITEQKLMSQWSAMHDVEKAIHLFLSENPEGGDLSASDLAQIIRCQIQGPYYQAAHIGKRLKELKIEQRRTNSCRSYRIDSKTKKVKEGMIELLLRSLAR